MSCTSPACCCSAHTSRPKTPPKFWPAPNEVLAGTTPAADALELLEIDLDELKGGGW